MTTGSPEPFVDVVKLEPVAIEVAAGVVRSGNFAGSCSRPSRSRGRSRSPFQPEHHAIEPAADPQEAPPDRRVRKNARSSARAAVIGSETVPMLPR